jgi:ketosteroid isomerase-like protein
MKILVITLLFFVATTVHAQTDDYESDREVLRTMLDEMKEALNKHDFDTAAKYLHSDGVITYYNGVVTVGHEQARAFFDRMLKDAMPVVKEYRVTGDVSAPAFFHGDTAVAYGVTEEFYKLTNGLEFTLNGLWSVTLQKNQDQWQIVNLHFSTNLFDNPLLNTAVRMQWIFSAIAFIGGMLLIFIVMRIRQKKSN